MTTENDSNYADIGNIEGILKIGNTGWVSDEHAWLGCSLGFALLYAD